MSLEPGIKGTASCTVSDKHTARSLRSGGLDVLATPIMVALMEEAALTSVRPYLDPGMDTVGTRLDVSHDSATPVGMRAWAESELVEIDRRRLVFKVRAFDEAGPIGEGTHERFIVNVEKFTAKCSPSWRNKRRERPAAESRGPLFIPSALMAPRWPPWFSAYLHPLPVSSSRVPPRAKKREIYCKSPFIFSPDAVIITLVSVFMRGVHRGQYPARLHISRLYQPGPAGLPAGLRLAEHVSPARRPRLLCRDYIHDNIRLHRHLRPGQRPGHPPLRPRAGHRRQRGHDGRRPPSASLSPAPSSPCASSPCPTAWAPAAWTPL